MLPVWSYKLITGAEIIDKQHKEIFERAAKMIESSKSGRLKKEAEGVVEYLENYYIKHFAAEEALQLKYNYPNHEGHKQLHDEFRAELNLLQQKFTVSGANYQVAIETITFMLEWLATHIDKIDRAFAAFIQENNSIKKIPASYTTK